MGVFGIILGVLGIIGGLFLPLFGGWIGGVAAIVLGVLALVLGVLARKKKGKGMGAIVLGAIAVILAVIMIFSTQSLMKELKTKISEKAEGYDVAKKYVDQADTTTGFIGFINSMYDEAKKNGEEEELQKEMEDALKLLTESSDSKSDSKPTEKPAAEPENADAQPAG